MPVSRSPNPADPNKGKAIRGRGGANVAKRSGGSNPQQHAPEGEDEVFHQAEAAGTSTSLRGRKKAATTSTGGTSRAARAAARSGAVSDSAVMEDQPESVAGALASPASARQEVAQLIQARAPPLADELRRLTNLMPGTPQSHNTNDPAERVNTQAPDTPQATQDPVVTPRHRQKERVANDIAAARNLYRQVSDFEAAVETQLTERKYDNLDNLHAKQYRLETENATTCLVNSSLAAVRRFPNEAAQLTKLYQNNVTVLEYTRRILREATHHHGQATGDTRPLEARSNTGSPRGNSGNEPTSPPRTPTAPGRSDLPSIGPDGVDPLLQGNIPPRVRATLANTASRPTVINLEPEPRIPGYVPGRTQGATPPRSQSQGRRPPPRDPPETTPPRSRESPDKFGFYQSSNPTNSSRNPAPNDEYMGSPAFYQALPEGWTTVPNLGAPVDFNQYSLMQRSGLMPSFDGTVEAYPSFKAHFILAVHQVALPIFAKFMALKAALEKAIELTQFLHTLEPGTTGYALLINELEDRFGGKERQLHRHASNIRFLPVATEDHHRHLQNFVDTVQAYHACLGTRAQVEITSYNHFNTIYYKLDRNLRMKYRTYCRTAGLSASREGSAANLLAWVKNVILATLRIEGSRQRPDDRQRPQGGAHKPEFKKQHMKGPMGRALVAEQGSPECVLCPGQEKAHSLDNCPTFKKKSVRDRKAVAFQLRRCFICLKTSHRASQCNASKCPCGQRHHLLLCTKEQQALHVQERPPGLDDLVPDESQLAETAGYVANFSHISKHPTYQPPPELIAERHWSERAFVLKVLEGENSQDAVSLRYVALTIRNPQNHKWTRTVALLDDGANVSLISERLVEKLGIKGERTPIHIGGVGGNSVSHLSCPSHVILEHLNGRIRYNVRMSSLPDPVGGLTMTDWATLSQQWEHLREIPFHPLPADPTVQLLIGNDLNFLHRSLNEVHARHNKNAPIARLTTFGWTATGPYRPPLNVVQVQTACKHVLTHVSNGEPLLINSEDRSALRLLATTVSQLENGHYQAPVLWRDAERPPFNAMHALRDWWRTWQSLKARPDIYQRYDDVIQGWLDKEYVRLVPMTEDRPIQCYHLPHFPVVREDHTSTKIRIVMNARASFLGQPSLNDCVLPGPAIMNDLANVLLNFRRFRYGISGDIQEMFLRIAMLPEDRAFHRFYYSPLGSELIREYEALVHQFGNRGSPFIAMYVIKNHAWKHRHRFPLAYEIVKSYSIVDDCMTSMPEIEHATQAVEELIELFKLCNMNIHKWAVSHPEILVNTQVATSNDAKYFMEHSEDHGTTLGLIWHANDSLGFQIPQVATPKYTKRSVLSLNNSLFDPHGLLLPLRMVGRMLFNEVCSHRPPLTWDQELPPPLVQRWQQWEAQLHDLKDLQVSRWLGLEQAHQLHVFGDASGAAFGACAYIVTDLGANIVAAKAHLKRSHTQTIPRLELDAAVEAMNLGLRLADVLAFDTTKVQYWSDSINTLHWIKNPARNLEDYVLRRAYTIRENTSPHQWHHVSTNFNPADLLSRGVDSRTLLNSQLWWHGPRFIVTGAWPDPMVKVQEYEPLPLQHEVDNLLRIFAGHQVPDPLANAGSFLQGVRVLQVLLKAMGAPRPKKQYAFQAWLRYEQRAWFRTQWLKVQSGGSLMWQGVKIFAQNELLVMTGRADQPPRPLLHPDSKLAQLWVVHVHEHELQHCGGHRTLASACRQQVWLWQGSSLFRKVSKNCVRCRRVLPRPRPQQMAPLPPARYALQPMTVFTEVSLDYAGPWHTKQGRGRVRQPRYLLLICCMASRACALEFTYSETTDSTIMALQRFASRYRLPTSIYSDNAAALVAAGKILNDWSGEQGNLPVHPGWTDIHWTFSHPQAPHSNGVTESLIKSAKHSIKKILKDEVLTDDLLRTVFAFAEDILNQRPIALVNNDPNDLETLTPAMLLGRAKGNIAPGPNSASQLLKNWSLANRMAERFWNQFKIEVIPELEKAAKWWAVVPPPAVGDAVVVLQLDPLQGSDWPVGTVVELHEGRDGLIRSVSVKVGGVIYRRNLRHIMPLV